MLLLAAGTTRLPAGFTRLAGGSTDTNVDGPAAVATFAYPQMLACDKAGNTFVLDSNNLAVRKVTAAGTVSTYLSAAPHSEIKLALTHPQTLGLDPNGDLLVNDDANLYRISPAGVVTKLAGGIHGNALAVAPDGTIYVAESTRIVKVAASGGAVIAVAGEVWKWGHVDATGEAARFNALNGAGFGPDGNLYVSDGNDSNAIRRVTPEGVVTTVFRFPTAQVGPAQLLFDPEGRVIVACWTDNKVVRIDLSTQQMEEIAGAVHSMEMASPNTLLIAHGNGDEMVYDSRPFYLLSAWVRGYVDGWTPTKVHASPGMTIATHAAQFDSPSGIALHPSGDLILSEIGSMRLRRISPAGAVTTLAGVPGASGWRDGAGAEARFFSPQGVAVDAAGNVYVADRGNHLLRQITPSGHVSTLAGTPGRAGFSDYSPPTELSPASGGRVLADAPSHPVRGRINGPEAVAVGPEGEVYVMDSGSGAIRIVRGGALQTWAVLPRGIQGSGLTCDGSGNLYVLDAAQSAVWKLTPNRAFSLLAGNRGRAGFADGKGPEAQFAHPWQGIGADAAGNVYVSDTGNNAVRKITPDGRVSTLAGGEYGQADGIGRAAQLTLPTGLVVTPSGMVYVVSSRSLRRITPDGVVTTLPGSPVPRQDSRYDKTRGFVAGMPDLRGLARGGDGALYVCDPVHGRVLKYVEEAPSKLLNVSVRARAGQGEQSLIAGFVCAGGEPTLALTRGVGPTLAAFNVTGVHPDPRLTVRATSGSVQQTNSDWAPSAEMDAAVKRTGAFQLPLASKDAALLAELPVGGYTAQIEGPDSGIALVEIYDADATRSSKLVNVSARVHLGSGADVLIAGFSVSPGAAKTLLIRGIGSTLKLYGITDAVTRPRIKLFRQSDGAVLSAAEGWTDTSEMAQAFQRVGAFPLQAGTGDAAMLVTVDPGLYTVQLSNLDGTAGVGLIEIYDAD